MSNLVVKDASTLPAHLATDKAVGNENLGADSLAIPYISLLQNMSKVCTKGSAEYIKGAEPGQFHNTVTGELSDEIVCANMFMDVVYSANKKQELGDDYQGDHPSFEAAVDHIEGQGLNANDYNIIEVHKHMLALFDEKSGELKSAAIYSFRNTALKSSRSWNSQILSEYPNADRFAGIWKIEPKLNSNNKGSWYTPAVSLIGYANEDVYESLKEKYSQWRSE